MDGKAFQALIQKGMGVAGRKLGLPFVVYRPRGANQPVRPQNRLILLNAAFAAEGGGLPHGPDYGDALWWGTFDSSYTQAGDYLVGENATYFIAREWPGLPVQCVLTNRQVTIVRPLPAAQGLYSGLFSSQGQFIIGEWPASLLESDRHSVALRSNETRLGSWDLLLPVLPIAPAIADVVTDDLGANYVVGSAEQSSLGWRLLVRQLGA